VPEYQLAWLRALAHACGLENRFVSSKEVAEELAEVERVVGRVTGQAAAANLSRLVSRGLAEALFANGQRRWRLTPAGFAAIAKLDAAGGTPAATAEQAPSVTATGLADRLADIIDAYTRGDLSMIALELAADVVVFIPGLNAIAGTYAGRGQVIALLGESLRYSLPELLVVERVEEAGEARVRVAARAVSPLGENSEIEMWIRARPDTSGAIVEVVIQPDSQWTFDSSVGTTWGTGPDDPPDAG
jgi:hypothetical protein